MKKLAKLPLEKIKIPNWDVRAFRDPDHKEALKKDLEKDGQLEPVHVLKQNGEYLLLEGRTRYEIAQELGMTEIDAYVIEDEIKDPYEYAFKVNVSKKGLGPVSKALYLQHLLETRHWSWGDLMQVLGIGHTTIARYMKLLDLPDEEQREYELGLKPIRDLYNEGLYSSTRGTNGKRRGGGGTRCPICGAFPEKGMGKWIYFCRDHEDLHGIVLEWIMSGEWKKQQ